MMSLKFHVLDFAREFDAQVFIDKKPRLAVPSLMRTTDRVIEALISITLRSHGVEKIPPFRFCLSPYPSLSCCFCHSHSAVCLDSSPWCSERATA